MAIKTLEERVKSLLTWPDNWNSYNVAAPQKEAVLRALDWIIGFRERIGKHFRDPDGIAGTEDCVQFDWYGPDYHFSLFIEDEGCSYLRVLGNDPYAKMDDGSFETEEQEKEIWNWFIGDAHHS